MYMKTPALVSMLLPSAALLALSVGCSSVHSPGVAASSDETPSYARHDRTEHHRVRSNGGGQASDLQNARATETEPAVAMTQRDRVSAVSVDRPPLLKPEIPSRRIGEGEFWVGGHWNLQSGSFVWETGRIEQYRAGQLFTSAGWAASPRGWEFTPERWHLPGQH